MELGYNKFKVGQKVWIDRTEYVENVDMIRNPQTIENITPVPVTDEGKDIITFSIDIVGSCFIYSETDLRPLEDTNVYIQ